MSASTPQPPPPPHHSNKSPKDSQVKKKKRPREGTLKAPSNAVIEAALAELAEQVREQEEQRQLKRRRTEWLARYNDLLSQRHKTSTHQRYMERVAERDDDCFEKLNEAVAEAAAVEEALKAHERNEPP